MAATKRHPLVWAIRPCIYDGIRRERGERFRLAGVPTDARLIEEQYVQAVRAKHSRYDCRRCDKAFVGGENYAIHLRRTHGLAANAARAEVEAP